MSALVTVESTTPIGEILNVMERDGAVIVANLLSSDLVQRLRNDLDSVTQNMHAGTRSGDPIVEKFWGTNTKRLGRLAERSPAFIEVLTNPLMTAISNELLLDNAVDWWLNSAQMMVIGPGENAQVLHRDVNNWPFSKLQSHLKSPSVGCSHWVNSLKRTVQQTLFLVVTDGKIFLIVRVSTWWCRQKWHREAGFSMPVAHCMVVAQIPRKMTGAWECTCRMWWVG